MKLEIVTTITAIAGCIFGLVGTVLGIINTRNASRRDRVLIKVVPMRTFRGGVEGFAISVENHSYFAVTVTEIGFTVTASDERIALLDFTDCVLPNRMEPRTSITAYLVPGAPNNITWYGIDEAYARTACGCQFTGTSGDLRNKTRFQRA